MKDTGLNSNSTPAYFYDDITHIAPEDIFAMGGKAVGIDLDNTCVYDSTLTFFKGVKEWLRKIEDAGIPIVIVTNTYKARAKAISARMGGIPYICDAGKPAVGCFTEACKITGVGLSEFVMIGDQLFTDIQGANNAGAISVRVRYKKREILMWPYFLMIRNREKLYLESKGLGDKV